MLTTVRPELIYTGDIEGFADRRLGYPVNAISRFSTLAMLWSVDDNSTATLMTEFYQELSNVELTKAEALRRAQIKILQNPGYAQYVRHPDSYLED